MKIIANNPAFKERRQRLRARQTGAEKILWQAIRNRKLSGHRFVRQYSLGPYVMDFYFPSKKLCIELDGQQHKSIEEKRYDKERTIYLAERDIKLVRFWNNEVINYLPQVLTMIYASLSQPLYHL